MRDYEEEGESLREPMPISKVALQADIRLFFSNKQLFYYLILR